MKPDIKIAIIGLGYVGLPLAMAFAKKYLTIGFDTNTKRISELNIGNDYTLEIDNTELKRLIQLNQNKFHGLSFTSAIENIKDCNLFIITVPTPVDKNNCPNLTPILQSSKMVGEILKKGDLVIYESTVYPGVTEEECVPTLEKHSGLLFNTDFFVGYSPERINAGDKQHTIYNTVKVTSGSTLETAKKVNDLYKSIIQVETHMAPSIKVAEAAKVIENSQRDINIAFVNELAKIFDKLNIDTKDVLTAARTKWNFLPFEPGLVGGHCIGVDPYYLAQKAQHSGYNPEIILAGRRINDSMGVWVASNVVKEMIKKGLQINNGTVLCLGITFKENCSDIRNSKAVDVVNELTDYGCKVDIYDPWANPDDVKKEYGLQSCKILEEIKKTNYDAIILTVAHKEFLKLNLLKYKKDQSSIIYDVKSVLPRDIVDKRL